jgi:hypothetical protein
VVAAGGACVALPDGCAANADPAIIELASNTAANFLNILLSFFV